METLLAYIGPGAGLTAIGAFLTLVVGLFVAVLGFVWYPIKRLLRRGSAGTATQPTPDAS